jgi:hypothetical protein
MEKFVADLLRPIPANRNDGVDAQLLRVGDDLVGDVAHDFLPVFFRPVVERIAAILVVPRIVPPRGRIPLTRSSVSSNDFSGQISPSKPSECR